MNFFIYYTIMIHVLRKTHALERTFKKIKCMFALMADVLDCWDEMFAESFVV